MRTKLIALEIVLLVISAGFYFRTFQGETDQTSGGTSQNQPVFANLKVSQIKTIELHGGEDKLVFRKIAQQDQQTGKSSGKQSKKKGTQTSSVQATMSKGPYRADFEPKWLMSSFHNYGVKQDQVQNRIIKPLRKLKRGTVEATGKSNLKEFGLDKSNRRRIVLKDDSNKVLREVVLGKRVTGFTDAGPAQLSSGGGGDQESIYYYNATNQDKFQVRLGQSEFSELPVDPQEWVNKEILSYDEKDVPLIAVKNKEKLFVLKRKQQKESGDKSSNNSSDSGSGSDSGSDSDSGSGSDSGSNSDSKSGSDKDWELYSGDFYAEGDFTRNAPMAWENNQLKWKGRNGQIQSVSLTKRKLNQTKASSLVSSLSSLEAEKVEAPISVPAQRNRISKQEKQKYGFAGNSPVVYLGEWRKQGRVLMFRAKFYIGKTSGGNGDNIYISSLKTTDAAQQVMRNMFGLPGAGGQAEQLIPVYSLSETDVDSVLSPEDLVKKEEDKKGGDGEDGKKSQDGKSGDSGSDGGGQGESSESSGSSADGSGDEETSSTSADEDGSSSEGETTGEEQGSTDQSSGSSEQ